VWLCGCVVVWLCGCVVVWLCGCAVVWLCGLCGCVVVRLCGCVVAWLLWLCGLCGCVVVIADVRLRAVSRHKLLLVTPLAASPVHLQVRPQATPRVSRHHRLRSRVCASSRAGCEQLHRRRRLGCHPSRTPPAVAHMARVPTVSDVRGTLGVSSNGCSVSCQLVPGSREKYLPLFAMVLQLCFPDLVGRGSALPRFPPLEERWKLCGTSGSFNRVLCDAVQCSGMLCNDHGVCCHVVWPSSGTSYAALQRRGKSTSQSFRRLLMSNVILTRRHRDWPLRLLLH
jgi:hypothetical protein